MEEAEALGLKKGVSVIVLRKICTDIRDRVVEVSDVTLCGDRTELVFTTPLKRW
ncbi:Transcriptional regulator OS=Streptomyces antimycoticus OX=68175 GN=SSPO_055370 PE=4 SV=1 [Streptomyces antimycoticus]